MTMPTPPHLAPPLGSPQRQPGRWSAPFSGLMAQLAAQPHRKRLVVGSTPTEAPIPQTDRPSSSVLLAEPPAAPSKVWALIPEFAFPFLAIAAPVVAVFVLGVVG